MKGAAAVTLSNENGPSRSRPSHIPAAASTPPYVPPTAASRAVLLAPAPCHPTVRRADGPAWSSDEPAVLGLRASRVDLTRRPNDRSPEREE